MPSIKTNIASGRITRRNLGFLRLTVQAAFALFCLFCGYRFYLFYLWATNASMVYVPRPPSIEAFLPISGLIGLKKLILTGKYDAVHPAGLTILIAALLISFLLRKGFCGWICPIGLASNLVEKLGLKFKTIHRPRIWLELPLLSLKYLLLAFFVFLIFIKMDLRGIQAFNQSAYNYVVDAKMLLFFIEPTPLTLWVIGSITVASFIFRNFWCRYLCPYGALLGIAASVGPTRIKRDRNTCIDCGKCDKKCPGAIPVSEKESINSPECIGCLECLAVCPVDDCLSVSSVYGRHQMSAVLIAFVIPTLFLSLWAWAYLSGHWRQEISPEILKMYYQRFFIF